MNIPEGFTIDAWTTPELGPDFWAAILVPDDGSTPDIWTMGWGSREDAVACVLEEWARAAHSETQEAGE